MAILAEKWSKANILLTYITKWHSLNNNDWLWWLFGVKISPFLSLLLWLWWIWPTPSRQLMFTASWNFEKLSEKNQEILFPWYAGNPAEAAVVSTLRNVVVYRLRHDAIRACSVISWHCDLWPAPSKQHNWFRKPIKGQCVILVRHIHKHTWLFRPRARLDVSGL